MDEEELVKYLAQLGNLTRLRIYKLLVRAGHEGVSVGVIQEKLNIPASTLSHHISKLVSIDLVRQNRRGAALYCTTNYELLDNVVKELIEGCCSDGQNTAATKGA